MSQWAGGRPRQISPDDEQFIVATANTRPTKLRRPFTRWSIRKLAEYLATNPDRSVLVGRERLRQLLRKHEITFQRTKTWKESNDPQREAKLARIEHVMHHFPHRVVAFDEFGPLTIRPQGGSGWQRKNHPDRLPANYHNCTASGSSTAATPSATTQALRHGLDPDHRRTPTWDRIRHAGSLAAVAVERPTTTLLMSPTPR